jgi:hypothetical protein
LLQKRLWISLRWWQGLLSLASDAHDKVKRRTLKPSVRNEATASKERTQ